MTSDPPTAKPLDPIFGLRWFLVLDAAWRTFTWSFSAAATCALVLKFRLWPRYASLGEVRAHLWQAVWDYARIGMAWIVLFNVVYLLALIAQRVGLGTPREGRYTLIPGRIPNRNLIASCFIAVLTKARYHPPFPGFIVFNLSNIPPFVWIMGRVFGPRSRSCYFIDPMLLDPHHIEIGRNVTLGFGAIIAAHSQEGDTIIIQKTVIEDDVLFGNNVSISGGCTIRRGAVVLGSAVVPPFTVIGENELWGGVPARKIKELPPYSLREHGDNAMEELLKALAASS